MLKISLVALFLMVMATFTISAASLPIPPNAETPRVLVADLG